MQNADEAKASKKEFSADKAMKAPAVTETVEVQAQAAPVAGPVAKPTSDSSLAVNQRGKAAAGEVTGFYRPKDGYTGTAVGGLSTRALAAPHWQLSAEGKLLRSNDLGKSWQIVQVGDKVVFRALCVTDREVWVGGAQGNLFYSSNAGAGWEQVKPSANGQNLTADITTIDFKDPQHGKLTTADHQTWITNDGGHAWQIETK